MEFIIGFVFVLLVLGMAWQDGRKRTCGFFGALALCIILTPLIGYFVVHMFPLKDQVGCTFCGNKQNEAEFCGICGKNADGELRPV